MGAQQCEPWPLLGASSRNVFEPISEQALAKNRWRRERACVLTTMPPRQPVLRKELHIIEA
jgi:hypothetical protein